MTWVAWAHKILAWVKKMAWVAWVGILAWVAWVHKILARVKKKKSVGRNFGMDLRCFIKKALLKISQSICAGVSREIELQAEDLKID